MIAALPRRGVATWAVRLAVALVLILLVGTVVLPVLVIAAGSLWSASFVRLAGSVTLANYVKFLTASDAAELFLTTLQITLGSAVLAVGLGALLAWIVARTDVPWKPVVRWLPVAPILASGLLTNIGWILLYSPTTGLVNLGLQRWLGLPGPPFNIFTMAGLITSLGTHLVPLSYLILLGPLESMNRSLDEASRASGAKLWRTLRHVTLPLLTPALLSAFTLTAIIAAQAFETPVIIGLPAKIRTYISSIYNTMASQNYSLASAQAMVYLAVIGALLIWNRRVTKQEARYALIGGKGSAPGVLHTGPWRYVLLLVVLLDFVISFGQLIAANVYLSFLPYFTATGQLPPPTLDNYVNALFTTRSLQAVFNSLQLAAEVSVVTVVFALVLAFLAYKTRWRGRRLAEEIGTLPVAFPPLVLSTALLITLLSIPGLVVLYNTIWIVVIVLSVVFLPFALRVIGSTIISIDNQLVEASRASGAGAFTTVRSIILPVTATAITSAFAIVFVYSLRELGGIALVTPPSTTLLPMQIYTFWQTAFLGNVYALNVVSFILTVLVLIVALTLVNLMSRGVWRTRRNAGFMSDDAFAEPNLELRPGQALP